jgi:peptide/nickel transport system substrate-binding protein
MFATSAPRRLRSPGFPGFFALLTALAVSACARPAPAPDHATTLTIGTAIPPTRDPSTGVPAIIDSLTLETPILIGWDGRPVPRAIDKAEWSPDGLTLRLRLRPGVVFHDGTVLTNSLMADILRNALRPGGRAVSTTVTSVAAEGKDEIVIRTAQPEGFLLSDISVANFSLPGHPNVGTGAFRLESKANPISLRAFDKYRGGRPAIDEVKISEYSTQRQAWAAMMRGEADVLYDVSVDSLDFVEAESSVQTHSFIRAYYHALVFNLTLPLFAQKDVRRALNAAIDREQVVEVSLRKRGIPADGPVWPYHFARAAGLPAYSYRPAAAKQLLDSIGFTAGRRHEPGEMPSRFRFTCLIAREDQRLQRIALVVQKQLFNVGVDMNVEVLPMREVQMRVVEGRFEAVLSEFGSLRSLSFLYALWHSPASDQPGLPNFHYTAADAALDRLRRAVKDDDVRAAVADVQHAFYDDPPAVFLDWTQASRALTSDIIVPNEEGRDIWGTIQLWRPASNLSASR